MDRRSIFSVWSAACAAILLVGGAAAGCMPDVPQDDSPDENAGTARVQPVLDSKAETLPLPNDAALDDQGTIPELEGYKENNAQGEFLSWLGTLHGWLTSTPIEVPFNGRLAKESVTKKAVHLYELEGGEVQKELTVDRVSYRKAKVKVADDQGEVGPVDGSYVTIHPAEGLAPDSEYGVVLTKQIKGADGESIVEPQPIFFAASEEPLVDENGEKTIESIPDDETAGQLEELRKSLQPLFARASKEDVQRGDVAMAFRWSTVRDPMTVVDPETGTLPLPNKAALDRGPAHPESQQETFPVAAVEGVELAEDDEGNPIHERTEDTAQAYFNQYLDRLHGWPPPPQTPITLPISAPIDETTVGPESVQVWMMPNSDDGKPAKVQVDDVTYNAEEGQIEVIRKSPLPTRRQFVAFATKEIKRSFEGSDKRFELKLPPALQMAVQPHPVLNDDGSSKVDRLSDEQAQAISVLREFMRPAAEFVETETETELDQLGAIWTWETWTDTFAVFDPNSGVIPFPNEFLRGDENGQVSLPTDGDMSAAETAIVEELNRRHGFSTTAPGWIPVDGPLKESTVTEENVPFLWRDGTPTPYDPSRYALEYRQEWGQIVVRAKQPWNRDYQTDPSKGGTLNLAAVMKGMQNPNGNPVMPSPAFVFLRSPFPLFKDGSSTVDPLDDSAAQQLEAARQSFNPLFQLAEGGLVDGLDIESRDEIALAYAFHPQNSTQTLQELRAQALAKLRARTNSSVKRACAPTCIANDPNEVQNPGSQYKGPDGMGTAVDMSNVGRIQWAAEFDTVDFRNSMGRLTNYENASAETVGISVFVPKTSGNAGCSAPFDVAIIQHGLTSHRIRTGMSLANELAAKCVASVAMDFPGHGGRSPSASTLHPETKPSDSGASFLTQDLVRSKNNFLQASIDVAVLAQIIQDDLLETAIDNNPNTDLFAGGEIEVGYVGHSLGGFIGFVTASVDSNINAVAFNGVGGGISDVLADGRLGGPILQALEDAGLEEGSFNRFRALSFIQWVADPIDPLAYAPFIVEEPVDAMSYAPSSGFSQGDQLAKNEVLVQMAKNPDGMDDEIVPNATTKRLVQSAGLSVSESTYNAPHGFFGLLDASNEYFQQTDCARRQAAAWIASGIRGEASYDSSLKASNCTGN